MSACLTTLRRTLGLLALACGLAAAQPADDVPASGHAPIQGEQFFLLADSSFGSADVARVRLEAPGRDWRRFAMEPYGGVDIRVYRIDDPLAFLQRQPNLHRIRVEAAFQGEGLSNALAFLWDRWYRESRRAMQRSFAAPARGELTRSLPELSVGETLREPTRFDAPLQFAPIPGLPLVDEFRYPLWEAQPIQPPEGTRLPGSSSEFIAAKPGNVEIPLGQRAPGLYLVEAMVGRYRATTALFVSDTVAVTKIAGGELLVWTADKASGRAVGGVELLWSDGVGLLGRGRSDAQGLLRLRQHSPERSYVLGRDPAGGVFISENFFYESEIHDTKVYAFTDRPLYRPGDLVQVRIAAREFKDALASVRAADGPLQLVVVDAAGSEIEQQRLQFSGERGTDTRFRLPPGAVAGGYELRMVYGGGVYSAAFRVADYVKPHFEIVMRLDDPKPRAGRAIEGSLDLVYPDGSPVRDARIELGLRAQHLGTVGHELAYLGQFPVTLGVSELRSDAQGRARFSLPPSEQPSRYLLTIFASDGAAYRVRSTQEILIERGAAQYRLSTAARFSQAGESVRFGFRQVAGDDAGAPARYAWLRLDDRSRGEGAIEADGFSHRFERSGNYSLQLLDADGRLLGATAHVVGGEGLRARAGTVAITFDRADYQEGEVAEALLSFPEPVEEALLSLERDRVEQVALLSRGADWLQIERIDAAQYRLRIPVQRAHAPNLSLSALYTRGGDYAFEVAGLKVAMPEIELEIRPEREVYRPGETVRLHFQSRLDGRPQPARLAVSVVDEMIYALQPELAPGIGEFFFHPRRNNVRTGASLSFIGYDVALPGRPQPPPAGNRSERGVKVLERPRREDVDTAAWAPDLVTDAEGRAVLEFRMPDSLTRWRVSVRAQSLEGEFRVGQRLAHLRSEQPLYLKWTGPQQFRQGDRPQLGLLAFNQGAAVEAELELEWLPAGRSTPERSRQSHRLAAGVQHLPLALPAVEAQTRLQARLWVQGAQADALEIDLKALPAEWHERFGQSLRIESAQTALALPADAGGVELSLAAGPAALFRTALDSLIDYPWGCVEQTASRLLPLALAWPALADLPEASRDRLRLVMAQGRLRLMHLAGPQAQFGWWGGDSRSDAFLTAYAYYADHHASRALGITLPDHHFTPVLELYAQQAGRLPPLQRMLVLEFAAAAGLPTRSLLEGALQALAARTHEPEPDPGLRDSLVLAAPHSALAADAALLLGLKLAEEQRLAAPAALQEARAGAEARLAASALPFARALRLRIGGAAAGEASALLQALAPEQSTLERALALAWLAPAAGDAGAVDGIEPGAGWVRSSDHGLLPRWRWAGTEPPTELALNRLPAAALVARLDYDSRLPAVAEPSPRIERRLWRLRPTDEALQFQLEPVPAGAALSSGALYLDEIRLHAGSERALRHGLLEVPLPPGADVERTTWGLSLLRAAGEAQAPALERARHEPGQLSYALPLDSLSGSQVFTHLVRFSQRGEFSLPPVRYSRMYQPEQQSFEAQPPWVRMRVEE